MKKEKSIVVGLVVVCVVVVSLVFAGLTPWNRGPEELGQSRSFTIAKAWWPVWDTFQIGTRQREEVVKSFRTTFLQSEDYVSALNDFKTGKADAATLWHNSSGKESINGALTTNNECRAKSHTQGDVTHRRITDEPDFPSGKPRNHLVKQTYDIGDNLIETVELQFSTGVLWLDNYSLINTNQDVRNASHKNFTEE